jgi:hypothetical protein
VRNILKTLRTDAESQLMAIICVSMLIIIGCVVKMKADHNNTTKQYQQTVRELRHENETLRATFKLDIIDREGTQPYIKVVARFRELGL